MPLPLTKRVKRALDVLFDEPMRSNLAKRLETEAAENIPFHDKSKSAEMDRIRFSLIKIIGENGVSEDSAFELAKTDWRDLFMAAGFGCSANEHNNWYRNLVSSNEFVSDTAKKPWWAFWRN